MWFRNIVLYRLREDVAYDAEAAWTRLAPLAFIPCGPLEKHRSGFVPPLGPETQPSPEPPPPLAHAAAGSLLLCLQQEEKLLPASVVRETLDQRVQEREDAEGRKPSKRERGRMREEVVHDLLPKAFSRYKRTWGYIDTETGYLVVDASSDKQADHFVEQLCEAWGGLRPAPVESRMPPSAVMTRWLAQQEHPGDVELGDEVVLEDPNAKGCEVRVKRQDLTAGDIRAHIKYGKRVRRLALTYAERVSGVLDTGLALRKLRFGDLVHEERIGMRERIGDDEPESEPEKIDADFAFMALELREMLPRMLDWFGGGEARHAD